MNKLLLLQSGLNCLATALNPARLTKPRFGVFRILAKQLIPACTLGVSLAGCASSTPKPKVNVSIDGSGSMTATRRRSLNALDETVDMLGPDATITIWRYDQRCDQLDSRDDVRDSGDFWALQDKELRFHKKEPGSRLDLALQSADSALSRTTQPMMLIFIGDGENTGGPLASWIQRIAAHPNLRSVVFIGLTPEFRDQRIADFAALGARFHPASFEGSAAVIRTARDELLATPTPTAATRSAPDGTQPSSNPPL